MTDRDRTHNLALFILPEFLFTLICGVASGMMMVACMPSLAADMATPCAWLPALHATTPRASCCGEQLAILL